MEYKYAFGVEYEYGGVEWRIESRVSHVSWSRQLKAYVIR